VTVEVEMSRGDRTVSVATSDSDITRCSVEAMVEALDRLLSVDISDASSNHKHGVDADAADTGPDPDDMSFADD